MKPDQNNLPSRQTLIFLIGAQEQSSYPLFYVPYSRNPHFIGRGDVIEKIETALNKQQRVAIAGVSGVGYARSPKIPCTEL